MRKLLSLLLVLTLTGCSSISIKPGFAPPPLQIRAGTDVFEEEENDSAGWYIGAALVLGAVIALAAIFPSGGGYYDDHCHCHGRY